MAAVQTEPPDTATATKSTKSRWSRYEARVTPYLYVSPFFILFLVFGVFTVGFTFWVSLHDWHIFDTASGGGTFVGIDNYVRLLDDGRFWRSVQNTFSILLMSTIPQMVLALILAELLSDRMLKGPHLFRSGLLIPNITSVVAIAIVFQSLFGRRSGLINVALDYLPFVEPIYWHGSRLGSHFAIATMVNWQWTGYNTLIFLAAMQAIPRDYMEAAQVDGAGRIKRWWKITVPLLRPAILFASVLSVIGNLQLFAQPLLFGSGVNSSGGNNQQYLTILLYLYNRGFSDFQFGYASAIAWALVFITAVAALAVFGGVGLLNRRDNRHEIRERKERDARARREVRS
jgi:cellobiose transport system permease protein